jgi:Y_Y_Y domain/Histidine kinase
LTAKATRHRRPEVTVSPHDLEIDYVGLSYVVPEKVRFQYRLMDHDTGWTDAGTRRQAFYTNLRPGHYTFLVRACNNDGVWNTKGASLAFFVPPAWFQTPWFQVLSVVSGLCLVYVLYLFRLRRDSLTMKKVFDERLEERTRLARELHDTLLQTIPGSKILADDAMETASDLTTARAVFGRISGWLGRATAEGRAVLDSLRHSISETNGLAGAFRRTFEDYGVRNGIALHLFGDGKEPRVASHCER